MSAIKVARRAVGYSVATTMSFSCPHFDPERDFCTRLKTDCVPGRTGCVLAGKTVFAVPAEERVREKEEENRRKAVRRSLGLPPVEESGDAPSRG